MVSQLQMAFWGDIFLLSFCTLSSQKHPWLKTTLRVCGNVIQTFDVSLSCLTVNMRRIKTHLRWSNDCFVGYQVAYRLDSGDPNQFITVEVGPDTRQFTASNLTPESAYIFRISAKTEQGWGAPAQAVVITTEIRGDANTYINTQWMNDAFIYIYIYTHTVPIYCSFKGRV